MKKENEILIIILNYLKYFKNNDMIYFKNIEIKENEIILYFNYNDYTYKYLTYLKKEIEKENLKIESNIIKHNKYLDILRNESLKENKLINEIKNKKYFPYMKIYYTE